MVANVPIEVQVETPVKTEEELTAELEEKRASLSEEAFIDYMNTERKAELNLPECAVYNPDLDEYYDGDVQTWNAEAKTYTYIQAEQPTPVQETETFTPTPVDIPEKMQAAIDEFDAAQLERLNSDPMLMVRSDYIILDDTEALRTLKEKTQLQYFHIWLNLARQQDNFFAKNIVGEVIFPRSAEELAEAKPGKYPPEDYGQKMSRRLQEATDAVNALGESITAEDCTELQEQYGYLIAPALQDMGKLDLLQIKPESPCTDAEQLAEFARYFAE